jgi:hypothetical protein
MPISENSQSDVPAIKAKNESTGAAVWANSQTGSAIVGQSVDQRGVLGESNNAQGVWGVSHAAFHGGVTGVNDNSGAQAGPGVLGQSRGTGVWGESETWMGVYGHSKSTTGGAGVMGQNDVGAGIFGKSINGVGISAVSETNEALHAETKSPTLAAITAYNLNPEGTGAALFAKKEGNVGHAGFFDGNVYVTRNLTVKGDVLLEGADFAEDFDVIERTEPGEVMVLTETGTLEPSAKAYDKKVVGVISGAGNYKPGIILDKQNNNGNRKPIAMMGKVYCKVDADASPIETGDMLTTSDIPGYAMRAVDPFKAFGAVIGKALASLKEGKGLIPILVVLQ